MPTTPTFALRYPAASDPADVPTDMGELATDVEAHLNQPTPVMGPSNYTHRNKLLAADTQPAHQENGNGTHYWGAGGASTLDVQLGRVAAGQLSVGAGTGALPVPVSNAPLSAIKAGNGIEFGHSNAAGFRSVLGADSGSGNSWLALHGEAGTNTGFRTRGNRASILRADLAGGFQFGNVALATGDDQALAILATLSNLGILRAGFADSSYSTTLPASPVDGQIHNLIVDATNGIVWTFRYNAGSASAYKWEFLGGHPLRAEIATSEPINGTGAWTNCATAGPDIVVPRPGDYLADVRAGLSATTSTAVGQIGVANASVGLTPVGTVTMESPVSGGYSSLAVNPSLPALAQGQTLRMVYNAAALHNYQLRTLTLIPRRVS